VLGLDGGRQEAMKTDCLRVYQPRHTKIRVGRANDGGYVIAAGLVYDHFLSGGISDDNSFERGILELYPLLVCDAHDPASDGAVPHPRFRFHRAHLPPNLMGLDFLVNEAKNALVKIDIEGDEWLWLPDAPLHCIAQLVVELHSPHLGRWDWSALERLARTHYLIHVHANNMDGIVEIDGVKVPATIEATWLRRDLAGVLEPSREPVPSPLDMPNNPGLPDHIVDWPPFVERI
jgi:hypothetical protein